METNEDKIKYLKTMAEQIIIHFLKNNFQDKNRLKTELERIHTIIEEATINIENYIPGSPTKASNGKKGIILYVKDKEKLSLVELNSFIETIIHEFYHSISRVNPKIEHIFLEEGYVTEITAETIRYVMENPIDIGEIKKDELVAILKEQNLENAYRNPSEFVRSTQVIMKDFGYNGMFEYMFSENGVTRICEIADSISPEFGDIMKKQDMKNTHSINYVYEQNFFNKMFEKIDFSNVSETSVEMNILLQKYLTDEGLIYKDSRLYDIVSKHNAEYVAYKEFYKQNKKLIPNELLSKIKTELDTFDFGYQTQDNRQKDVKKMIDIIINGYEQSSIKPNMFQTNSYFAKLICYDMYQRGIQTPTEKDVEQYSNFLVYNSNSEKIILDMVSSEFNQVYQESNKRKENT